MKAFFAALMLLLAMALLPSAARAQTPIYNQYSPGWFNCAGQFGTGKASTATAYTFALSDANTCVTSANSAAQTLTVPTNAIVAFPIGTAIEVRQLGAGAVTVSPAAGVSIDDSIGDLTVGNQYGEIVLNKIATNTWQTQANLTGAPYFQTITMPSLPAVTSCMKLRAGCPQILTYGNGAQEGIGFSAGQVGCTTACKAYMELYTSGDFDLEFNVAAPDYDIVTNVTTDSGSGITAQNDEGDALDFFHVGSANTSGNCGYSPAGLLNSIPFNNCLMSIFSGNLADVPYVLIDNFVGMIDAEWYDNLENHWIGDSTPTLWAHVTSTGSNAALVIGSAATGSTTLLQAANGGLSEAGITTGSNTDTVCLAGTVFTLQAAPCTISSLRFKHSVSPYTGDALAELNKLQVRSYQMNGANVDPNAGRTQIGLIAENIAAVEPRCAIYENDLKTPKSYRPECVTALLVSASQEFQRREQRELDWIYALLALIVLHMAHSMHLHRRVRTLERR